LEVNHKEARFPSMELHLPQNDESQTLKAMKAEDVITRFPRRLRGTHPKSLIDSKTETGMA
jgi:hypothetical protein